MKNIIKKSIIIVLMLVINLSFFTPLLAKAKVVNPSLPINNNDKYYSVILYYNDGTDKSKRISIKSNGNFPELPQPTRNNYRFEGWYTSQSDGTKINSGTPFKYNKDINLYAHWKLTNIEGKVNYKGYDMFYYNSYFSHPATEYDSHLATLSSHMTLFSMNLDNPKSSDDKEWYDKQSDTVKGFFETIGFENFEANSYYHERTSFDSIGVAIASKKVGDYTVIAVVPRSGGYFLEWGNNVFLGDGSNSDYMHEGWYNAANNLLDFLDKYVTKNNITGNVKLWMAGYSRGGATTNIAAGLLDNKIDKGQKIFSTGAKLTHDNLYAYTFEAPQGANFNSEKVKSPNSIIYNNIWNIVNPNDLVTKVAMVEWGFTRFGTDKYITTRLYDQSSYEDNRHTFHSLFSHHANQFPYYADQFEMYEAISLGSKDVTKSNYDANIASTLLLENMVKSIGTRENYVAQYQPVLKNVLLQLMNDDANVSDKAIENIVSNYLIKLSGVDFDTVLSIFTDTNGNLNKDSEKYEGTIIPLIKMLDSVSAEIPNELLSIGVQASYIFQNHEPDVTIVHMKAQDTYYVEDYIKEYRDYINLVPLMDDADLYRAYFYGFNDLKFGHMKDGKIDAGTNVDGIIIGKSSVKNLNRMVAVGYYSYLTDEKMQFFIPARYLRYDPQRVQYKMQVKSYSIKPEHTIGYEVYYQKLNQPKVSIDSYEEKKVNLNSQIYEVNTTLRDREYYGGTAFGSGSIVIISVAGLVLLGVIGYSIVYKKKNKKQNKKENKKKR